MHILELFSYEHRCFRVCNVHDARMGYLCEEFLSSWRFV